MIITLALPVIEKIANRALKYDPIALKKLEHIENHIIQIHCTDWRFDFCLIPTRNGIQLERKAPGKPNTIIKSTLPNFLKLLSKGGETSALFHYPVDIAGNTRDLETLKDAFTQLDIDWEDALSEHLGDAIAHKLCFYMTKANDSRKEAQETLARNLQEYLHFEAQALPTRLEVETFMKDVSTLKNDVDRLEAKILKQQY